MYVFSNLLARYKYKSCYKPFLTHTESKLKTNSRSFLDFVRKKKSSGGIPCCIPCIPVHLDEKSGSSSESIYNLFSSYFNTLYGYTQLRLPIRFLIFFSLTLISQVTVILHFTLLSMLYFKMFKASKS